MRDLLRELRDFHFELIPAEVALKFQRGLQPRHTLLQLGIHAGQQAMIQREPHARTEDRQPGQQNSREPGREAHPDGDAVHGCSTRRQ